MTYFSLDQLALALTVVSLLLAGTRPARADDEPPAAPEVAQVAGVIEITIIGNADMRARAREALAADSVAPKVLRWRAAERWEPAELMSSGSDAEVLLRCWLILTDPTHAHLYFADRAAKRFLIRDLELTGHLDELDREALSQALELSIRALLDDQQAGLDRDEARSLLTPKPPPSPTPQLQPPALTTTRGVQSGFSANVAWDIGYHSREFGFVQGPALALRYERSASRYRAAFWGNAHYQVEKTYDGSLVGLALRTLAFRSGLELTTPLSSSTWFGGGSLGGGVDVAHFAPRFGRADTTVALTPARSTAVPVACGALLIGNEISTHLRLTVALLAGVPLVAVHYDLDVGAARQRVVSPWLIRPGLSVEIGVH